MEVVKILGQAAPILVEAGPSEASEILYIVPENKGCVISYLNILNRHDIDVPISIQVGSSENLDFNPELTWVENNMNVYTKCSAQRLKGATLAAGDMVKVTIYTIGDEICFTLFGSEFDQNFSYTGDGGGGDYGYGY